MNRTLLLLPGLLLLIAMHCEHDPVVISEYDPVILTRSELESSVKIGAAKQIEETGKIYVKDGYIYINEPYKGFHVIDNSDPENPTAVQFLKCPGSTDMEIKNHVFYVNQATDLIALKLSDDANSVEVTKRIKNSFPEIISPDGFAAVDVPEGSVVTGWLLKKE